jgi:hypothetical protein
MGELLTSLERVEAIASIEIRQIQKDDCADHHWRQPTHLALVGQ